MDILTPGHKYALSNMEQPLHHQTLQFIEKEPDPANPTHFRTVNDGTTNEEVLRVLIDRLTGMNAKFPCRENSCVLTHLDEALMWLEKRTRDRAARGVEGRPLA